MDADWPLIGVRFALYATLSGLFGLSAFSLYGLAAGERADALALCPWLVASSLLGLLFSGVALVLLAAAMAGAPAWPIDREAIGMLLTGSSTGTAWEARMVALVVAFFVALIAAGRTALLGLVTLAAGIALATLAWTGHGAMDEGPTGWVHLVADILHLLAAGAWVGALLGLTLLVVRPAARVDVAHLRLTHRALHGFGLVGTVVVGTIVVTGLVNGWLLVGADGLPRLPNTLYPRAAWKAKRRDGVEHIACLAAGEAMEQQPSATWADAQRWRRVGMRGTAAHGAPGCPVSAECLDDGAAAVGAAGELGIVKGHGVLAVRDAPRAASSAPQK